MHLIEPVDPRGGLLGHALDFVKSGGVPAPVFLKASLDGGKEDALFFRAWGRKDRKIGFCASAKMKKKGGIAAIIQNHVGVTAILPFKDAVGVFPVLFKGFALDRKDRNALIGNGSGRMVLGREDVAGRPTHFGAEGHQGFDQDGCLDRHVQGSRDAGSGQRLGFRVFLANGHQARHFGFGDPNFLVTPGGQREVSNEVVGKLRIFGNSVHGSCLHSRIFRTTGSRVSLDTPRETRGTIERRFIRAFRRAWRVEPRRSAPRRNGKDPSLCSGP